MKFLTLSAILIAVQSAPSFEDAEIAPWFKPSIVGGEPVANQSVYPWVASISISGSSHSCGGTLIAKNLLLTAGHCSAGSASSRKVTVWRYDISKTAASEQAVQYSVEKIITHPSYTGSPVPLNDVSVWVLKQTSNPANRVVQTVNYAKTADHPLFPGKVRAIGWGTTRQGGGGSLATKLRQVDINLISNAECKKSYESQYPNGVPDSTVCAAEAEGGKDTCQGDSGGPLFQTNEAGEVVVSGVTSWGIGCADKGNPGVYARVGSFSSWIDAQVAQYAA
ncbi:hypothetical protein HK099_007229 [Clydaea vesicula]|uniref:Peptidase S1 domain-containing protein n=1 Tax=Clydaea vesicula TaxID=447962 RepID=A0AAD5TXB4_9FUNG|nr:hypothetical protein HK099_007229 [Clydaea vesicula]KAJ3397550.1 hypothetical protein HDU92_006345 [Lobulomyces angularis]